MIYRSFFKKTFLYNIASEQLQTHVFLWKILQIEISLKHSKVLFTTKSTTDSKITASPLQRLKQDTYCQLYNNIKCTVKRCTADTTTELSFFFFFCFIKQPEKFVHQSLRERCKEDASVLKSMVNSIMKKILMLLETFQFAAFSKKIRLEENKR